MIILRYRDGITELKRMMLIQKAFKDKYDRMHARGIKIPLEMNYLVLHLRVKSKFSKLKQKSETEHRNRSLK